MGDSLTPKSVWGPDAVVGAADYGFTHGVFVRAVANLEDHLNRHSCISTVTHISRYDDMSRMDMVKTPIHFMNIAEPPLIGKSQL